MKRFEDYFTVLKGSFGSFEFAVRAKHLLLLQQSGRNNNKNLPSVSHRQRNVHDRCPSLNFYQLKTSLNQLN